MTVVCSLLCLIRSRKRQVSRKLVAKIKIKAKRTGGYVELTISDRKAEVEDKMLLPAMSAYIGTEAQIVTSKRCGCYMDDA